jgi:hypothetical protein
MSPDFSLDPESFQQLLAAAFAVQESRVDTQSLAAIIQIQRRIAIGELDAENAIHVIANQTGKVADASGVAIGLIRGHQLVYRAGIGSAADFVGRHVAATLSVSAESVNREILRVENAQTDPRIEAAICRHLGAESLLIMPIYQGQSVAGVLEVLFSEAHVFQDREVRAYRLMAGLVGEALSHAAQLEEKKAVAGAHLAVPPAIDQMTCELQALPVNQNRLAEPEGRQPIYQIYEVALAMAGKVPAFWRLPGLATLFRNGVDRTPLSIPQWSAVMATVIALVIIGWAVHGDRHSVMKGRSEAQTPNAQSQALDPQLVFTSAKPSATVNDSLSRTLAGPAESMRGKSAFKRVRVGENEVDYVAEDVTVRYFIPSPSARRGRAGYNQVEIGKDVTVRYFASNPATVRPVGTVAQPVNRTLSEPEKAVAPKLVR